MNVTEWLMLSALGVAAVAVTRRAQATTANTTSVPTDRAVVPSGREGERLLREFLDRNTPSTDALDLLI